jgi:hypothetical protein
MEAVEAAPPGSPASGLAPAAAAGASARDAAAEAYLAPIQAYFDGDYRRALDLLDGLPAASRQARFLTALFGAAARHALYLLGGEEDEALLAAAVEDLRAARRASPSFAPHPDHFSPRFIAFFRDHP